MRSIDFGDPGIQACKEPFSPVSTLADEYAAKMAELPGCDVIPARHSTGRPEAAHGRPRPRDD